MLRKIRKHFLLVLIAVTLFCFVVPTQVFAAKTVTVLNGEVSITDSANSISESGGTVTVTAKGGLFSQTTNTITIKNETTSKAKLTFSYAASNYNSFSESSASGNYEAIMDAGASVTMSIKGKSGLSNNTATLTLSAFSLTAVADSSNVTFSYDSAYGSITVGGAAVANGAVINISSAGADLVATPVSGAAFLGWVNTADNSVMSSSTSYKITPAADMSVKAVFVGANSKPWFGVGSGAAQTQSYGLLSMGKFTYYTVASYTYLYDDLNAAAAAAQSGTAKYVVLANSGTLAAGTYTIPSGVTLLIPFDSANTCYTTNAQWAGETMTKPTAYRTLTMDNGANLVVNGSMCVSGKHAYTNSGGQSNSPSGPLGFVRMAQGSNITINSGGKLYAYGYIIGSGNVTAKSGSSVYEIMQMPEFRGGDQSTSMANSVFPLSQFYIQNIEVPLTLEAGATEHAYGTLYASRSYFATGADLFGTSNSMFVIKSGSITKWYNGGTDRMTFDLNGTIEMASISLQVDTSAINSSSYVLPIHGGFTIHVGTGSNLTIPASQKVLMQPGAQLIIDEGATCTVNSALYLYDAAQWGAYCIWGHAGAGDANGWDTPLIPVSYSPTRTYVRPNVLPRGLFTDGSGNPVYITEDPKIYEAIFAKNAGDLIAEEDLAEFLTILPDASILVNGTLSGNIYTTEGGANIHSTGAGQFTQTAGENSSVYQLMMASDYSYNTGNAKYYVEAPSAPAQLKNADGTYAAGKAITYHYDAAAGAWRCETHTGVETDHNCDVCGFVTECVDANPADHNCDICGETISECADTDGDALCDVCSENLCSHEKKTLVEGQPATCDTGGWNAYYDCDDCDLLFADKAGTTEITTLEDWKTGDGKIEALGHSYESTVTDATCATEGATVYTCTVCADTYSEPIAALGHKGGTATCLAKAECEVCGEEYGELADHTYGDVTYTWTGYTACTASHACGIEGCSHIETAEATVTNAVTTAATCSAPGVRTYTAAFDVDWAESQTITEEITIDPSAHKDAEGDKDHKCDYCGDSVGSCSYESVVTNPTCTERGFTTHTCSECGDTYTDSETESLGHSYESVVTAPTCTEKGYTTHTCTVCDDTYTDSEVAATGHTWTDATCTVAKTCSACGATEGEATGHSYGSAVTAPTCTEKGYTTYTCTACGDSYTGDDVAATGHSYTSAVTKQPTCTEAGVKTFTCSTCGNTKTEEIAATGHTVVTDAAVEATCTEEGKTEGSHCSACNEVLVAQEVVPAKGHTEEAIPGKDATCTETGLTSGKKCFTCGESLTAQEVIPALGHNYETVVTAPTCTEAGYTTYTCSTCSDTYTDNETAATGHTAGEAVKENEVAASCTAAGSYDEVVYCSMCNEELSREAKTVDMLAHAEAEIPAVPATCEAAGLTAGMKCSTCGEIITAQTEIPALGHNYELTDSKDVTCTEDGYKTYTCKNDASHTYTETVEATGHSYNDGVVTTQPTCTVAGVKTFTCSCGDTYTEEVAALGHEQVSHEAQAPTCTEIGWDAYVTCSHCDYSTYVEIPALGHGMVTDAAVEATCTKTGLTEGSHCSRCDDATTAQEVVPAKGHTAAAAVKENEVAATCGAAGSYESVVYCSVCDAEISRETVTVNATGDHSYTTEAERKDATCTEEGYVIMSCTCGATETTTLSKVGHTEGEAVVENEVAASCTQEGSYDAVVYCTVCGEELSRETVATAAKGHSYTNYVASGELKTASCDHGCGSTDTKVIENAESDGSIEILPEAPEDPEETEQNKAEVTVDTGLLEGIAKDGLKLHLNSELLELVFDNAALCDVLEDHKGKSNVSIVVENTTPEETTDKLVFDIHLTVDGEKQESSNFGEGEVTVTIPLDKLNLTNKQTVKVWYVERDENGNEKNRTLMEDGFKHDRDNKKVHFKTNHFSEYEVEVVDEESDTSVTVTFDNKTGSTPLAIVDYSNAGSVGESYTFTVTCEKVCVVAYTENGTDYTRMDATLVSGNTYRFTVENLTENMQFAIRLLGDVTEDGKVNAIDAARIKALVLNNTYTSLQKIVGNVTGDTLFNAIDAARVKAHALNGAAFAW